MSIKKLLIADFDETITYKDTISVLSKLPYFVRARSRCRKRTYQFDEIPNWDHFVSYYLGVYSNSVGKIARVLPVLETDQMAISRNEYLDRLKKEISYQNELKTAIELKSIDHIVDSGVFNGISVDDLKDFLISLKKDADIESDIIKADFTPFISKFLENSTNGFKILSINWSKEFIYYMVNGSGTSDNVKKEFVQIKNIYCNELLLSKDDKQLYTGEMSRQVVAGSDKFQLLQEISDKQLKNQENSSIWFVGDSETDLLGLLHPDVNGVLLLDPTIDEKQMAKFIKIVKTLLNSCEKSIDEFISSNDVQYIKLFEKYKDSNKFFYLAKTWKALEHLIL